MRSRQILQRRERVFLTLVNDPLHLVDELTKDPLMQEEIDQRAQIADRSHFLHNDEEKFLDFHRIPVDVDVHKEPQTRQIVERHAEVKQSLANQTQRLN